MEKDIETIIWLLEEVIKENNKMSQKLNFLIKNQIKNHDNNVPNPHQFIIKPPGSTIINENEYEKKRLILMGNHLVDYDIKLKNKTAHYGHKDRRKRTNRFWMKWKNL